MEVIPNLLNCEMIFVSILANCCPGFVRASVAKCFRQDKTRTVYRICIKLGILVGNSEWMKPIETQGQGSKVKVTATLTLAIFTFFCVVGTIKLTPCTQSCSNMACELAIARRWTLFKLDVRGQRSRSRSAVFTWAIELVPYIQSCWNLAYNTCNYYRWLMLIK